MKDLKFSNNIKILRNNGSKMNYTYVRNEVTYEQQSLGYKEKNFLNQIIR